MWGKGFHILYEIIHKNCSFTRVFFTKLLPFNTIEFPSPWKMYYVFPSISYKYWMHSKSMKY